MENTASEYVVKYRTLLGEVEKLLKSKDGLEKKVDANQKILAELVAQPLTIENEAKINSLLDENKELARQELELKAKVLASKSELDKYATIVEQHYTQEMMAKTQDIENQIYYLMHQAKEIIHGNPSNIKETLSLKELYYKIKELDDQFRRIVDQHNADRLTVNMPVLALELHLPSIFSYFVRGLLNLTDGMPPYEYRFMQTYNLK